MYQVIGSSKTRTLRVLWALEEMGLPYEHTPVAPRSQTVTALNPSGKVPLLIDEGRVIFDSTAILMFLADRHGLLSFPAGSHDRARQDALMLRTLDEMDGVLWTAARHSFVLPEDQRLPAIKDSLRWEWTRNLGHLARDLSGEFLMGDRMTIADIVCAHCLSWGISAKFEIDAPVLLDYLDRMRARPAYVRAAA